MGHIKKYKQSSFLKPQGIWQLCHGGSLRKKRRGRGVRPLSCKESLHVVFKINKAILKSQSLRSNQAFKMTGTIIQRYAKKFFVKIEQISIQHDHIHCLIRTSKRSHFHYFFRVVSGQIAQQFRNEGLLKPFFNTVTDTLLNSTNTTKKSEIKTSKTLKLWRFRPFSRVIRGYRAWKIARNYIRLNEKEIRGEIVYSKDRLRGLSAGEWKLLWT